MNYKNNGSNFSESQLLSLINAVAKRKDNFWQAWPKIDPCQERHGIDA